MMLDRKMLLIKERVGFLKLVDTFDIYDPVTGAQIGIARETAGVLLKLVRLLISKHLLPALVEVRERDDTPVLMTLRRGFTFLRASVSVRDGMNMEVGLLKSKLFSIGGGFHVLDAQQQPIAEVKGDWKGWNFRFLAPDGSELGTVTKKWAGLGKELLTSADNYIIALAEGRQLPRNTAMLLLAAGLAIDTVYKEK
jgi:uncharacterized protein YxjI